MFKSLLIIILVALVLWVARIVTMRLKNRATGNSQKLEPNKNMLQCAQCKTYIPSEDAIIKGDESFCSAQHLEDWNKSA